MVAPSGLLLYTMLHALFHLPGINAVDDSSEDCPGDSLRVRDSCYVPMHPTLTYYEASDECANLGGILAITKSDHERRMLQESAMEFNWDSVWMGATGEPISWFWDTANRDHLVYQGCWADYDDDRTLINEQTLTYNTPEECIGRCFDLDEPYAGVQLTEEGDMLCHCGDAHGFHESVPPNQCHGTCPGGQQGARQGQRDKSIPYCGNYERQMIFFVEDAMDQMKASADVKAWSSNSDEGDCAIVNLNQGAKWEQRSCSDDKHYFICSLRRSESKCIGQGHHWENNMGCIGFFNYSAISWFAAKDMCFDKNGVLLTLPPPRLKDFPKKMKGLWWIGLTRQAWEQDDGTRLPSYNGWAGYQPSYRRMMDDDEICLSASRSYNYRWTNVNCDLKMNFFCELDTDYAYPHDYTTSGSFTTARNVKTTRRPSPRRPPSQSGDNQRPPKNQDDQMIMVAGVAAGAGITLVLLIIGIVIACRRCRRKNTHHSSTESKRGPLPRIPESSTKHRHSNHQPRGGTKHSARSSKVRQERDPSNYKKPKAQSNKYVRGPGRGEDNGAYVMSDPPMKLLNHMSLKNLNDSGEYDYIDPTPRKSNGKDTGKTRTYQSLKSKSGSVRHVYEDMPQARSERGVVQQPKQDDYFVPIDPYI